MKFCSVSEQDFSNLLFKILFNIKKNQLNIYFLNVNVINLNKKSGSVINCKYFLKRSYYKNMSKNSNNKFQFMNVLKLRLLQKYEFKKFKL